MTFHESRGNLRRGGAKRYFSLPDMNLDLFHKNGPYWGEGGGGGKHSILLICCHVEGGVTVTLYGIGYEGMGRWKAFINTHHGREKFCRGKDGLS